MVDETKVTESGWYGSCEECGATIPYGARQHWSSSSAGEPAEGPFCTLACLRDHEKRKTEEADAEANARLRVVAHDLLAACEAHLSLLEDMDRGGLDAETALRRAIEIAEMMRVAVAWARGETEGGGT